VLRRPVEVTAHNGRSNNHDEQPLTTHSGYDEIFRYCQVNV